MARGSMEEKYGYDSESNDENTCATQETWHASGLQLAHEQCLQRPNEHAKCNHTRHYARHEHLYPTSDPRFGHIFCAPAGSLGLFNYFKLLKYYYKMDQINLGDCESLPSKQKMRTRSVDRQIMIAKKMLGWSFLSKNVCFEHGKQTCIC